MNPYTAHREGLITREERDAEIMNREYKTLDPDQRAAVDEMVRVCRTVGEYAHRIFPDLGAEVYAYERQDGSVSWGMDGLTDGCNFKRGIVE